MCLCITNNINNIPFYYMFIGLFPFIYIDLCVYIYTYIKSNLHI